MSLLFLSNFHFLAIREEESSSSIQIQSNFHFPKGGLNSSSSSSSSDFQDLCAITPLQWVWHREKVKSWKQILVKKPLIFTVSNGQVAKQGGLITSFRHDDYSDMYMKMIAGEEISDKERQVYLESLKKEIIYIIREKCVNSYTERPFYRPMIEKAIKETGYSVTSYQCVKVQALKVMNLLKNVVPIRRAQMRLRIVAFVGGKLIKTRLDLISITEAEEVNDDDEYIVVILIDPGYFKYVEELVREVAKHYGWLEILKIKEIADDERIF